MTEAAAFWCLDGLSSTMTNTTATWWNVGWNVVFAFVCIKKKFIQYFYKISGSAFMVLRHRRAHSAYTFFTSPWIGTQEPRMRLASALKKLEWRRPLWLDLPRQLLCHHDAPAIHGTTATQLLSLTPDREYETILCRHNELKTTLLP